MPYWWSKSCHCGQWLMNAPLRWYLVEERIEEIVETIFFRKSSFTKYHVLYVALIQFLSESKWHIRDPIWRVVFAPPCWSISAGRGSLKSCYGVKFCWMLAENALFMSKEIWWFLRYINILSFVNFQPWFEPTRALMGWTKVVPKLYFS